MFTVDQLLEVAARQRSSLSARGGLDEIRLAWDAFNRYVTDIIEKRQTLNVSNFCKIGWKVEESNGDGQRPKMRPHFNISEAFARSSHADARSMVACPASLLTLLEDFNFSKCALRFSQGLVKDQVFMCLRAIIQALGEAIATGLDVSIDMEVGKLSSKERVVRFDFVADYYAQEGLDMPDANSRRLESSGYRPSVSFAPPSKEAVQTLVLEGNANLKKTTAKAIENGGWAESDAMTSLKRPNTGDSVNLYGGAYAASSVSGMSHHEMAQHEAMSRHLQQVAREAEEAIKVQDDWEDHLQRCIDEEKKDLAFRLELAKDYSDSLKDQIRFQEDRKVSGRQQAIEMASLHDYPDFSVPPSDQISVHDYLQERKKHLKEDLDHQVEIKQRQKQMQKQRERELDQLSTELSHRDMAQKRLEEQEKHDQQKSHLIESWNNGKRIRNVRNAIESYAKQSSAPTARSGLADMVSQLSQNLDKTGKLRQQQPPHSARLSQGSSQPPQQPSVTFGLESLPPSTPRSEVPSSRPVTGSVRRFPIGAAANLALTKQRMQERGMM
eukprot:TRINITY_DN17826_c0_g2_i1.p1 TRINITY_DN17826_c0_g2~~TRINITY_DN17826_c0_g2_i1.p1  ORF type:complete len:554 (-),score=109.10 TRINITY_DN17826_c0_g2_i1:82-1743(-)